MTLILTIINTLFSILTYFIIIYSVLTFILAPYHPVREAMARVAEPMMAPFRRLIPPMGGFDLSPMILILVIQVVQWLITSILRAVF